MCLRRIGPPHPHGCAVLCSGSNDGFCASQSFSQQDIHIKGSFSGQPCVCVSVLFFAIVCVCICAHLCVILRTSVLVVHADCTSYCARVQPIKVHIGTLALFLWLYLSCSLLLPPPPFSSIFPFPYFSSLYDISAVLRQLLCTSPVCISYWILPGEPLPFAIANQSIDTSENNSSSWTNFGFHTLQKLSSLECSAIVEVEANVCLPSFA